MDALMYGRKLLVAAALTVAAVNRRISGERAPTEPSPNVLAEFEIAKGGDLVILPVTIRGKEYPFALSTASERTIVDTRLRPQLGDPLPRTEQSRRFRYEEFPAVTMKVGTQSFTPATPIVCSDLSEIEEFYGHKTLGFVGLDFLRHRIVQIDFDQGLFRVLSSPGVSDHPVGRNVRPLIADPLGSGTYSIGIGISGDISFFLVDTLFARELAVGPRQMEELLKSGAVKYLQETSFMLSPNARFCMREGVLDRASRDGWVERNLPLLEQEQNRVGLEFLSKFKLTFDFQEEYLHMAPGKRYGERGLFMRTGMELALRNGNVTVVSAFPKQAAAKAGIQDGDVLEQIDGKAARELGMFEIRKTLAQQDRTLLKLRRPARDGREASEYTVNLENGKPTLASTRPDPHVEATPSAR